MANNNKLLKELDKQHIPNEINFFWALLLYKNYSKTFKKKKIGFKLGEISKVHFRVNKELLQHICESFKK